MDVASSEFYDKAAGKYNLAGEGKVLSTEELVEFYAQLVDKYPIISIEDGCDENDWDGHKLLTDRIGHKVQLVGDDLFVTNTEKLAEGIEKGIEKGEKNKAIEIAKNLLDILDDETISMKTGLTIEEVKRLRD